jgi:hypothetical protein
MCFSASMDLTAGMLVTGLGVDALSHVTKREQRPLAALPLLLGVHQLVETVVWWRVDGQASAQASAVAVFVYLLIALGIVPLLVPYAFLRLKLTPPAIGWICLGAGVASMGLDLWGMGHGPMTAHRDGHHLAYDPSMPYSQIGLPLYVFATCLPAILARSNLIRLFGVMNLIVVSILAALAQSGVISLWCVWAAATSFLICAYLRREARANLVPDLS